MPLVEYWTGSARIHLWIMLGASLLLLIASIISASNLLLSRTFSRRSEIATRMALGAGRGQILAQLGVERYVRRDDSGSGRVGRGAIGDLIPRPLGPGDIPRLPDASLDSGAFGFAAGVAALAARRMHARPGMGGDTSKLSPRCGKAARGYRCRIV